MKNRRMEASELEGSPVTPLKPIPTRKRLLDLSIALVGVLLSSPLWVLIGVSIKVEDRGPILYKQRRWGRGGKPFSLYKFRTMRPNSELVFGISQATERDPRVTRVGRFLRATGMDELPQFLNILSGEMSFVGPRALAVEERLVDEWGNQIDYESIKGFQSRLAVQPGLTGLATIYLPKDAPPWQKFKLDLQYIDEWTLLGDIRLIATSFSISLRGKWEARDPKTQRDAGKAFSADRSQGDRPQSEGSASESTQSGELPPSNARGE